MEKSKKNVLFSRLSLLILLSGVLSFASCDKEEGNDKPTIDPPFVTNGFYVVNEGSLGSPGFFETYNYRTNQLVKNDIELGNTACYADQWYGKIYFISKQDKIVTIVDEQTMTEVGSIEEIPDGRAFVGVTETIGVVTTAEGAYLLNLKDYKLGKVLEKTDGVECGGVSVHGDYLFVLQKELGILVYDTKKDFALVRELGMASVGFVRTKDGSLWAANTNQLIKINPMTLKTEIVALPEQCEILNNWEGWNKGFLTASPSENVLWFIKATYSWGGGNQIYRYEIGNPTSLDKPFIQSSDKTDNFYGGGIYIDPTQDIIVATFVNDAYNDNRLVLFNTKTGKEIHRHTYSGTIFPGMILFHY